MGELEDRINSVLNDPEQLGEITRLARSLMGGGQSGSGENESSFQSSMPDFMSQLGLNPDMLNKIGSMVSPAGDGGRAQALLAAMKPYLSDKRKRKMDKAMMLARIAKLAGLAMGEGEGSADD